ncbi:MAG: hypothetical protein IKH66_05440, partial [Campylobacter sp.]|nr:hypothetical protein [Campylobacter sp.]
FFRANSFEDALKVIKGMVGINGVDLSIIQIFINETYTHTKTILFYNILTFILILVFKNSLIFAQNKNKLSYTLYFSFLFLISILFMFMGKYSEFIYFNF